MYLWKSCVLISIQTAKPDLEMPLATGREKKTTTWTFGPASTIYCTYKGIQTRHRHPCDKPRLILICPTKRHLAKEHIDFTLVHKLTLNNTQTKHGKSESEHAAARLVRGQNSESCIFAGHVVISRFHARKPLRLPGFIPGGVDGQPLAKSPAVSLIAPEPEPPAAFRGNALYHSETNEN